MKLMMLNGKAFIYVGNFQKEWDTFKYTYLFWDELQYQKAKWLLLLVTKNVWNNDDSRLYLIKRTTILRFIIVTNSLISWPSICYVTYTE